LIVELAAEARDMTALASPAVSEDARPIVMLEVRAVVSTGAVTLAAVVAVEAELP